MRAISRMLVTGLLLAGLAAPINDVKAFMPFGGFVTYWSPCVGGIFIWVQNPDPVRGLPYSGPFIVTPGSFFYFVPPLIGSAIKGQSDVWIYCKPYFGQRVTFAGTLPI